MNIFVQTPSTAAYVDSVCPKGVATVTLGSDTTGTYLWSTGDTSKTITVNDTGIYTLVVSIPGSICARQITYHVGPLDCPVPPVVTELELPNIFSPNGDSVNEFFMPVTTGDFDAFDIKIFDRWGLLMFESTDSHFKWPGTTKQGKAAPAGTYYYIAETTLSGVKNKALKGTVTLVR
jgi:gliding motility-associated-like protein